jgi:elongation factor P
MSFEDRIIDIRLPIKVDLAVKEAAPAVRGNTVQGGSKQVVLETGATINTPMFINEGDLIRVNTETGEYTERVDKK